MSSSCPAQKDATDPRVPKGAKARESFASAAYSSRSWARRLQRGAQAALLIALCASGCRQTRTDQVSTSTAAARPQADQAGPAISVLPSPRGSAKKLRPTSFREAKSQLRTLYENKVATTLYAGCRFSKWRVDYASCCHRPTRRERLEWEHVVPAAAFGRHFKAWTRGHDRCVNKRGKAFRGRRCARKVSAEFRRMEGDMHNLFPTIGAINAARGHLPLGLVDGEARAPEQGSFGSCDIEMDAEHFEPRPAVRGDVARAYLYMDATYPRFGVVDPTVRPLLLRWHRADPPDEWERTRNAYIELVQGRANPWIE